MAFLPSTCQTGIVARLAASILVAVLGSAPDAVAADVSEDDVKLALLYKITRFIEWPEHDHDDFLLCIAGADTFDSAKRRLTVRSVGERAIRPVLVKDDLTSIHCDALYIARTEADRIPELTRSVRDLPVLTVSDAPGFASDGGLIGLTTRNSRIQININVAASKRAGLTISSQLLELARIVGDRQAKL
ncbi:MAG: YfiR family protein [Pseudomonadota bacterium]